MLDDLIAGLIEQGDWLALAVVALLLVLKHRSDRRGFVLETDCAKRCPTPKEAGPQAEEAPADQDQ